MSLKVKCESNYKVEENRNDNIMGIQSFIDLNLPISTLSMSIKFELMKNISKYEESSTLNTYMCYIDALLNDFYYNGCIDGDKYNNLAIKSSKDLNIENAILNLIEEIFLSNFSYYSKKINK